jgi:hypothetical protein
MAHDPGGKVRLRLPTDVIGSALFSPCDRYRHTLSRQWEPGKRFALWIGMNPSTAEGDVDDPTVRREYLYTRDRLGLGAYAKANVMDYRATNPRALLALSPEERCSGVNLRHIDHLARQASVVIAAWGSLPKMLRPHAEAVEALLHLRGIEVRCLGFTADGSPRHPLYVRRDADLVPYPREV